MSRAQQAALCRRLRCYSTKWVPWWSVFFGGWREEMEILESLWNHRGVTCSSGRGEEPTCRVVLMNDSHATVKRWWGCFHFLIFEVPGDCSMCHPFDIRGCCEIMFVFVSLTVKHPPEHLIRPLGHQEKIYSYLRWTPRSHFRAGRGIVHLLQWSLLTKEVGRKVELGVAATDRSLRSSFLSCVSSLIFNTSYLNVTIMATHCSQNGFLTFCVGTKRKWHRG